MKPTCLLILGILFVCLGCEQKKVQPMHDPWSALTIISEDRTHITIFADSDTAIVNVHHTGTIFYRPKKITIDTIKVVFSQQERDSIYNLAKDIMATPPHVQHRCTDFVGDLTLKIYYGEVCTQGIDYSGVCNWNILSDKTMQLHNILKKRLKNVFLGEGDAGRSHTGN